MKKILAIMLSAMLVTSITGCNGGGDDEPVQDSDVSEVHETLDTTEETEEIDVTTEVDFSNVFWGDAYKQMILDDLFEVGAYAENGEYFEYNNDVSGFSLCDLDEDGIPELLINVPAIDDNTTSFVYTFKNGVHSIGRLYYSVLYKLPDYAGLYTYMRAGPWGTGWSICYEIINGEVKTFSNFSDELGDIESRIILINDKNPDNEAIPTDDSQKFYFNHEEITEDEYKRLFDEFFNADNKITIANYTLDNIEDMFLNYTVN
ncbi:MAG: hypothetical protein FWH07_05385 [Oscillospiraceae bacterium]|nr:hypothetical protein [Oscillospiraceae bacterium]